jgi:hypothetical protein
MYQASDVERLLRAIMGIRARPGLTTAKASKGQGAIQSVGRAGQTVRPSFHFLSQTSAGKLSILSRLVAILMFDVSGIM